jgi:uncharacterized protein YndB with AHSA1/START domain
VTDLATTESVLLIQRTFAGTPEQIYRAWTDQTLQRRWFFPEHTEIVSCTSDAREGGEWTCAFTIPGGSVHSEYGTYLELSPWNRIVQTLKNDKGFVPGELFESVIAIDLVELAPGRTEMTFQQTALMSDQLRSGMDEGWNSCFNQLDRLLAGDL